MAELTLTDIAKHFGDAAALKSVTTTMRDGEFLALLGPSGCGKSTLLRLLAGFEHPTKGSIRIGDREVANAASRLNVPPEDRNIGIVFQSYALWPHMSVRRNVGYPLEIRRLSKAEREARIDAALAATALEPYGDRMPSDLSGGQRQRVALARCLVSDPTAVLLDEPLANLDVALRASMQAVFSDFHRRTTATMVYVTHDQAEAMAMADRIAVMNNGVIVQLDTPEALYARPRSRFVAEFIGEGAVVPLTGATQSDTGAEATLLGARLKVETDTALPAFACLRPENLTIAETGDIRARVERVTYLGGRYRLNLTAASGEALVTQSATRLTPGDQIGLALSAPWAFAAA
ncbi:ABC transporter ATP-binding protein [Celeribacter baekdonensis]|uniref:ABC transporter n=1 Tax=Celeribacter baekdonensis B30 TaxID=1208323 RepID=K2JIG7_9RHOB|nr:ABC transporter ATP-binding protein [Celeribacter baekdonensis]EKE70429.1 ABC transporter [Celeribacter baekdonensis B30]